MSMFDEEVSDTDPDINLRSNSGSSDGALSAQTAMETIHNVSRNCRIATSLVTTDRGSNSAQDAID